MRASRFHEVYNIKTYTLSRGLRHQNIHAFLRFSTVSAAAVPRSGGDGCVEGGDEARRMRRVKLSHILRLVFSRPTG